MQITDSLEKTLMLGKIEGRRIRRRRGRDGQMASPTQWTWVWASSADGERQGSLACFSPWGCKESDTTEQLNNNNKDVKKCPQSKVSCCLKEGGREERRRRRGGRRNDEKSGPFSSSSPFMTVTLGRTANIMQPWEIPKQDKVSTEEGRLKVEQAYCQGIIGPVF